MVKLWLREAVSRYSICLSIPLIPHPFPGTSLEEVASAEESPFDPVLTFPHCVVKAMPVISPFPILIHCVPSLYWWPPSCFMSFNFTKVGWNHVKGAWYMLDELSLLHITPTGMKCIYWWNNKGDSEQIQNSDCKKGPLKEYSNLLGK